MTFGMGELLLSFEKLWRETFECGWVMSLWGCGGGGGQLLPHRCHLWLSASAAEDDGDDDWDRPWGQNFKHYSFPIFIHCVLSVLIP